jgi:hypothetical protein
MLTVQTTTGEKCNAVEIKNKEQFLKLKNKYNEENENGKEKEDYIIKIIYFLNGMLDFISINKLKLPEEMKETVPSKK